MQNAASESELTSQSPLDATTPSEVMRRRQIKVIVTVVAVLSVLLFTCLKQTAVCDSCRQTHFTEESGQLQLRHSSIRLLSSVFVGNLVFPSQSMD